MLNYVVCFVLILFLTGCAISLSISTPITGDVERGAQLSGSDDAPPCLTCHQSVSGQVGFSVGPNLAGIAQRGLEQQAETERQAHSLHISKIQGRVCRFDWGV
jgi:cytochrome c2